MATTAQLLVIRNDAESGPGHWPRWAADAGVRLDLLEADAGTPVPRTAGESDGVVLLGGGLMPDADADHPWLPDERALVRDCVDQGVPLLGICLGAQVMAVALGGAAREKHGTPERGVTDIELLPAAQDDPLLHGLGGRVRAMQNHQDVITQVPGEAVELAVTPAWPHQAFRVGECAWATQWHPEADPARMSGWNAERLAAQGFDLTAMQARGREHAAELARTWDEVAKRFLSLVVARAQRRG